MVKVTKKSGKAWVTFSFSPTDNVENVEILGEWNEWKPESMKKKKNGEYSITKIIKTNADYQFGYRVDGNRWLVETDCQIVPSPFNSNNSLLKI